MSQFNSFDSKNNIRRDRDVQGKPVAKKSSQDKSLKQNRQHERNR